MTQTTIEPLEILSSLGINEMPTIVPVQGGFDMAMWKVEYANQTYALRVFRPGELTDCEREQVVMDAARTAGVPVPEVHAAGVWQEHPALLITWLPGRTVADELGHDCGIYGTWESNLAACKQRSMKYVLLTYSVNGQMHGFLGTARVNKLYKIACVTCSSTRWRCCI